MTDSREINGNPLRSSLFHTGLILSVMVWAPLSLLTFALPYRTRFWVISRWCVAMRGWLRWTCNVSIEISGTENIPERAGIVMSKHQSAWETISLFQWFYPQTWVLKRELLRIPLFGWALALMDPIAIDRGAGREAVRQIVEQGRQRLDDDRWVVVFPEGTRVPPGRRGRYRLGGAVLATETGTPVTPVAHNAGEVWARGGFLIRPGTIRVRVGPPVEARDRRPDEVMSDVQGWIEEQMLAISRTPYTGEAYDRKR